METRQTRNIVLCLPLFYEYARNIRRGVMDWVDAHPSWRLIELNPDNPMESAELGDRSHGVICWMMPDMPMYPALSAWNVPIVECGSFTGPSGSKNWAKVTFDRQSINRLAIEHFQTLGFESVGYVGNLLRENGVLVPRAGGLRDLALNAGMEWVEFDLHASSPIIDPSWIWRTSELTGLVDFLHSIPKPIGLLAQDDYIGAMMCEGAHVEGLNVPEELGELGQGDRLIGQSGGKTLSSIVLPGVKVGWRAAEVLKDWLDGKAPENKVEYIPCEEIMVRESTGGKSRDLRIERAKRILNRHAASGLTVKELASLSGVSDKTLRAKFRNLNGVEIAPSIREQRISGAIRMLVETDLSIREIGEKSGFSTPSNFFNFVKRQTGMGPAEYRRKHGSV